MPADLPTIPGDVVEALFHQPTIDLQSFLINKGRAFTFSSRYSDIGNGDSTYLFVDNPSGSGYDYDIVVLPRSTGLVDLNISFNAAQNDGTTVTAHNLKSGSPRSFSGTVEESTTGDTGSRPTHGTTFIEDFVPGSGAGGANIAAEVIDAIAYTVDEGSNKLIELNNQAGGSLTRMAVNVVIFEIDGTYKEVE